MKSTRLTLAKQYMANPKGCPEYEEYFREFENELTKPVEEESSKKKVK